MTPVEILLEVGTAAVLAGLLLKGRSEETALESKPIPIPVRNRR